ncbi:golgi apparatus membrane protein [Acrasis kona]|uniref:Golgi apparatus membrane protein n=1 Tax=Acrasis kona TaxID=1008807 RepID=A0AAW2YVS7_9EUKA
MRVPWVLRFMFSEHIELNPTGVVFLMITFIGFITTLGLSVYEVVETAMKLEFYKAYDIYYLNSLDMLLTFVMLYFAMEAVLNENVFQLVAYLVASAVQVGGIIYAAVDSWTNSIIDKPSRWTNLATACVVTLCFLLQLLMAIPLYKRFGWKMYHLIGTNENLIKQYRVYSVFVTMLKLDLLFTLEIALIGFFYVTYDNVIPSYTGLGIGLILTLFSSPIVLYFGVNRENFILCSIFLVWCLGMPGYTIYKIIEIWMKDKFHKHAGSFSDNTIRGLLTIIVAVALFVRCILMATLTTTMKNFGKGLKNVLDGTHKNTSSTPLFTLDEYGTVVMNKNITSINDNLSTNEDTRLITHQKSKPWYRVK